MKLLKPKTFVVFALAGLAGAVLLHTSQNVQHAEERLAGIEREVQKEEEKIRMLRAEWASLNSPARLERLADEFLDLVPPASDQMTGGRVEFFDEPEILDDPEGYQPLTQPVNLGGEAPKPAEKPTPPQQETVQKKEKAFGELIEELGGEP